MKAIRTLPMVLVLALVGTATLSALDWDWGGVIDNLSTPTVALSSASSVFTMDQRDRAALWAEMHFNPQLSLTVQGSYAYELQLPYLFDVDLLKLDWQILPAVRATLGRFVFSDFTGHVLNFKLDGAQIAVNYPTVVLTASAGFSGLELKPYSLILMSRSDSADLSNSSVYFAAPRLVEKFDVLFPNVMSRQDLNLSLIMQQDLRSSGSLIQSGQQQPAVPGLAGGSLFTEYVGVGLSGAIIASLYYDAFVYGNVGSTLSYLTDASSGTGFSWQYAPIQAFLGGVGLHYYSEAALSSRVELLAIVSSGDSDNTTFQEGNTAGPSTLFVPISQEPLGALGLAYQPQWGNLALINANYSFKPVSSLQLITKALAFLRPTTGAISTGGLNLTATDLYLGTEFDETANFRPFSDLGLSLSIGYFIPNGNVFVGQAALPVFAGQLEVSFSF